MVNPWRSRHLLPKDNNNVLLYILDNGADQEFYGIGYYSKEIGVWMLSDVFGHGMKIDDEMELIAWCYLPNVPGLKKEEY